MTAGERAPSRPHLTGAGPWGWGLVQRVAPGHRWHVAFAAAVAGIAALHLGGLDTAPPGLYNDEASIGYNAWAVSTAGVDEHGVSYPLFYEAFGEYKGPVSLYPLAVLLKVLPLTPSTVRLPSALYGIALAVVAGLIAWRVTRSRPVALLMLLTAGVEPWLFVEARTAFEAIAMVLALVVALWCVTHAGSRWAGWWFAGCGTALGVAVFAYTPGRLYAAIMAVLVAVCFSVAPVPWRDRRAPVVLVPVALAYAVLLDWSSRHPGALLGRFDLLSITSDHPSLALLVRRFLFNYVQYLGAPFLFTHGDGNLRHSTGFGGMLLLVTLPAVVGGLVVCLRRWREPLPQLTLLALVAAPVPAALTMDGTPHSLRAVAMLPPLLLLMTYGWEVVWPWLVSRRLLLGVAAALVVVECGGYFWDLYIEWPNRALAWFDTGESPAIARAHELAAGHEVFISTSLDVPYIQALFTLRPDPHAYAQDGLKVLGMAVLDPAKVAAASRRGDILVLAPGDAAPSGAHLLFVQSVDVTRHTSQAGTPDITQVTLVSVYRR